MRKMRKRVDSAEMVKRARQAAGVNQAGLAKLLGVTQSRVSEWENGRREPTAEAWIAMGNLALYPDCLAYYERAGIVAQRLEQVDWAADELLKFLKTLDSKIGDVAEEGLKGKPARERFERAMQILTSIAPQRALSALSRAALEEYLKSLERMRKGITDELWETIKRIRKHRKRR
jgi:DNA-binding XRE family transcriptional regulator